MKTMIAAVVVAGVLGGGPAFAQVPYDRIVKAESEPANWLTYAGSYKSQRYTPARPDQQAERVAAEARLGLPASGGWRLRNLAPRGRRRDVHDGAAEHGDGARRAHRPAAVELDAEDSGRRDRDRLASRQSRRRRARRHGVRRIDRAATWRRSTRSRAALRWDVTVDDNKLGYYLTLAPLAIDGKIIVGVSGAENGIRGFVDAYDAKTGKRLWRTAYDPGAGRAGKRHLGRQGQLEDRRRFDVADRFVRSRA